jgi:hypothetical protein
LNGRIRAYLQEFRPELKVYSIAQVISEQNPGCEFARKFGGSGAPVVVETEELDLRLGLLDSSGNFMLYCKEVGGLQLRPILA